jgi:hypothetical protein
VEVLSDKPYSVFDELFIPRLRAPTLVSFDTTGAALAATVSGFDRLGLHSWAVSAIYDTRLPEPTVSLSYGNNQLAPWFLSGAVSRISNRSVLVDTSGSPVGTDLITDTQATVTASRPLWTANVAFGFEGLHRDERFTPNGGGFAFPFRTETLLGPTASASWSAGENTSYAGTRRGLAATAAASFFPKSLGSDFDLADLRGSLTTWIPLPLSSRHTFALGVRGRSLVGPEGGMLQLGGIPLSAYSYPEQALGWPGPNNVHLPNIAFAEPLRGYELFSFQVTSAAILSARYRYPFIIDRGITSYLWLLPSIFARQLDLEAFFEGAQTWGGQGPPMPVSVGAMAKLRTLWGSSVPISLFYQFAWRNDATSSEEHIFGLSFD